MIAGSFVSTNEGNRVQVPETERSIHVSDLDVANILSIITTPHHRPHKRGTLRDDHLHSSQVGDESSNIYRSISWSSAPMDPHWWKLISLVSRLLRSGSRTCFVVSLPLLDSTKFATLQYSRCRHSGKLYIRRHTPSISIQIL